MKLPAGLDVEIWLLRTNEEITYLEEDELNEIHCPVNDVEVNDGYKSIMLS